MIGNKKELHVKNALESDVWKDNPDVKLDMISYYGLPINWVDGESFGTICVLDSKSNTYSGKYRKFLHLMQEMIENDLELLLINKRLKELSIIDELTKSYNRRFAINLLSDLANEFERYHRPFSVISIDLDGFKKINDEYGHIVGDDILKEISNVIKSSIRKVDIFARMGGDEFIVICRETNEKQINKVEKNIEKAVQNSTLLQQYNLTVSMGAATNNQVQDIDNLLITADNKLYTSKKKKNK